MVTERLVRHQRVSTTLLTLDMEGLASLVSSAPTGAVSVGGGSSVLEVDGVPVFVKRIPITDLELAHPRSTANLFDVPTLCQYGMFRLPGPGFSAWRELDANLVVTGGVLAGETESFPLLHHWRVLPGRPPVACEHQDVDAVVAQFGGAPGVRARLEALAGATFSLVLFSEYVPQALADWLTDPLGWAEPFEQQLFDVVAFLRSRELLHMDGHFANMRADDDRVHLVDFGLATSPRFDLSPAERDFAARHVDHDADYAAMRLVNWLITAVCGVPTPTSAGPELEARNKFVRRCADGDIPRDVPAAVATLLARHAPAAARMNDFCSRLFDGDIHAQFPAPSLS